MNTSPSLPPPDLAATWERFKFARARELRNWVEAERALATARLAGAGDSGPGDRLQAAEAALQSAIVEFAASEDRGDPIPMAIGLLRLAEKALDSGADGHNGRRADRHGAGDRRRSLRQET